MQSCRAARLQFKRRLKTAETVGERGQLEASDNKLALLMVGLDFGASARVLMHSAAHE